MDQLEEGNGVEAPLTEQQMEQQEEEDDADLR